MVGKGSIVKYENCYYRVTRATKNTVNLGPVFGNKVEHKGIQKSESSKHTTNGAITGLKAKPIGYVR